MTNWIEWHGEIPSTGEYAAFECNECKKKSNYTLYEDSLGNVFLPHPICLECRCTMRLVKTTFWPEELLKPPNEKTIREVLGASAEDDPGPGIEGSS